MEIIEQLTDLHTVEVSFHGPQENYFESTDVGCCSCSAGPGSYAGSSTQEDER
jgi:hypothetical protein